jgi:hypothetical protein
MSMLIFLINQTPCVYHFNLYLLIISVFEILLEVSAGASWKDAFVKIIPKRKRVEEKDDEPDEGTESSN